MKHKKILAVLLGMILIFALSACGNDDDDYGPLLEALKKEELYQGDLTTGTVGDTIKNSFFEWKVNSVKSETELNGKSAESGKKFVVVNISVKYD